MRGLERAKNAGISHVEMGVPASEILCQKNVRYSVAEGMVLMKEMVDYAHNAGMSVRLGVQTAFGCAFEGKIAQDKVVDMARAFLAMGCDELALADSAGLGNPLQVEKTVEAILPLAGNVPVALHLHDTRGQGLANLLAGLNAGITHFDTSLGGLGGCPFIPTAKGNIPTEDSAHLLHEMGVDTGIDLVKMGAISRQMEDFLGVELPGKMLRL
jgi:hydroxymethylglutaryl-CoA lyase